MSQHQLKQDIRKAQQALVQSQVQLQTSKVNIYNHFEQHPYYWLSVPVVGFSLGWLLNYHFTVGRWVWVTTAIEKKFFQELVRRLFS